MMLNAYGDDIVVESLRGFSHDFAYNLDLGNLGNFVLSFAELQLFGRLGLGYRPVLTSNVDDITSKPFSLVQGGGGIWVGNYRPAYRIIVDSLFKSPNLVKCIVLPSSFHNCDDAVDCFDERFTVFCRDKKSYEYCVGRNKRASFFIHDDMAFFSNFSELDWKSLPDSDDKNIVAACGKVKKFMSETTDFGVGNFIRTDSEKTDINGRFGNIFDVSTVLGLPPRCEVTKKLVYDGAQIMAHAVGMFDEINTNRLHVAITAALLGKRVNLYDNSYGKLFSVYDQSLSRFGNVRKVV